MIRPSWLLHGSAVLVACALSACGEDAPDPEMVAKGRDAFAVCATCHSIAEGAPHMTGPNLHDVYGRQAGSAEGFGYSDAMRSSDLVWRAEQLDRYLENPQRTVRGTSMIYDGVRDASEREAIIAYLRAQ